MAMTAQAAHKEMIWDGDTLIYRLQVSPDGWFYVNDQPTGKATDVNGGWPTAPEHFGMQMADLVPGWGRVPVGSAHAEFVQMPKGGSDSISASPLPPVATAHGRLSASGCG